jgi:hypothetical protein
MVGAGFRANVMARCDASRNQARNQSALIERRAQ